MTRQRAYDAWLATIVCGFIAIGFVYLWYVGPFDTPDENSHYEYARVLAARGRAPDAGEEDAALRARVTELMMDLRVGLPIKDTQGRLTDRPVFKSELGRQPATYYWPAAAIASISPEEPWPQLRRMRLWSLALGAATVFVVGLAGRELLAHESLAGWLLPLVLALTPGFMWMSASLNNDGLANLGGAIAFWGLARAAARGADAAALGLLGAGLVLGLAGKRTVVALLPGIVVMATWWGISTIRARAARFVVAASALAVVASAPLWLVVPGAQATEWRVGHGAQSVASGGLFGENALYVVPGEALRQDFTAIEGRVTAAVWARAAFDSPARVIVDLRQGSLNARSSASVDETWRPLRVDLNGRPGQPMTIELSAEGGAALFDGLAAAGGERRGLPLTGVGGLEGSWDGRTFVNLLRNPSGELADRDLRASAKMALAALGTPIEAVVPLLEGLRSPPLIYDEVVTRLDFTVETYIGRFSWLTLRMPDGAYLAVYLAAIPAAIGLVLAAGRARTAPWVGVCGALVVGALLVAVGPFLVGAFGAEWPQGRYLYPVAAPISCLFALGLAAATPRAARVPVLGAVALLGLGLNFVALRLTLIPHYAWWSIS